MGLPQKLVGIPFRQQAASVIKHLQFILYWEDWGDDTCESWRLWLDMDGWTVDQAVRLSICGAESCVEPCIEAEKNNPRSSTHECPNPDFWEEICTRRRVIQSYYDILGLNLLRPFDYITWASGKETILLWKQMVDWYQYKQQQTR